MSELKQRWQSTPKWIKIIIYVILGLIAAVVLGFIFGYVIKLLWNWLMPELFGLKEITYWQAIGLFILGRILLGSFGGNNNSDPKCNRNGATTAPENGSGFESKSWKYYDEWWEKEGKKAFDSYLGSAKDDKEN